MDLEANPVGRMFFSGKHGAGGSSGLSGSLSRKVEIRGRSRPEESREEVLERTRQERERRKQHKVETRSATLIQVRFGHWAHAPPLHEF